MTEEIFRNEFKNWLKVATKEEIETTRNLIKTMEETNKEEDKEKFKEYIKNKLTNFKILEAKNQATNFIKEQMEFIEKKDFLTDKEEKNILIKECYELLKEIEKTKTPIEVKNIGKKTQIFITKYNSSFQEKVNNSIKSFEQLFDENYQNELLLNQTKKVDEEIKKIYKTDLMGLCSMNANFHTPQDERVLKEFLNIINSASTEELKEISDSIDSIVHKEISDSIVYNESEKKIKNEVYRIVNNYKMNNYIQKATSEYFELEEEMNSFLQINDKKRK